MVIPIYDDLPLRHIRWPSVNWFLIGINIFAFFLIYSEVFGDAQLADWIIGPPAPLTLITSLFFHSSFLHLVSNMLFLYVFGDNVEDAMGSFYYLLFYLCCGVTAGVFYIYSTPDSITPLVGASSAISGVCAAFLLLHPRATIAGVFPPLTMVLQPLWLISILVGQKRGAIFGLQAPLFVFHASALLFIGAWMFIQLMNASLGGLGHVAWMAHIGGIAAGLVLTPFFKRRDQPLFHRGAPASPEAEETGAPPLEKRGE